MQVARGEVLRKPYLDGLRGVAAVMVFFGHLAIALLPALVTFSTSEAHSQAEIALGLSPVSVLWQGNFAVCLFFVLSGFVLSDFCRNSRISFPAKVVRRYFRLALPMLMTSAFAWLVMVLGLYKNLDAALQVTHSGWLSMWYRAFEPSIFGMAKEALYGAFVDGHANYNSNLWTMQIELVGSLYVFLLHTLFRNMILRVAIAALFCWLNHKNYYALFTFGAILFDLDEHLAAAATRVLPAPRLREGVVVAVFAVGVYLGAMPAVGNEMTPPWHAWLPHTHNAMGWHMVGAAIVIAALLRSGIMQQVFGGRTGRYLGKLSFVLYLIHLPIICSLTAWLALAMHGWWYPVVLLVAGAVTVVTVFAASTLLYLYVDVYTTAFSRSAGKVFDTWFSSPAVPAAPARVPEPLTYAGANP